MKKILLIILAIIVIILIAAATRPSTFEVKRSTSISASAATVYALIASVKEWQGWSPWEGRDPAVVKTYADGPLGPETIYRWKGNDKVGEGEMRLSEAVPTSRVGYDVKFIKPYPGDMKSTFDIAPDGDKTNVMWKMTGTNTYDMKLMGMFGMMNMDKTTGGDFEAGLGKLRGVAEQREADAKAAAAAAAAAASAAAAKKAEEEAAAAAAASQHGTVSGTKAVNMGMGAKTPKGNEKPKRDMQ